MKTGPKHKLKNEGGGGKHEQFIFVCDFFYQKIYILII